MCHLKDGTVVGTFRRRFPPFALCTYVKADRLYVTGSRCYSEDLIQGGLEIPCVLIFEGGATLTTKAKKLVVSALLGVASGVFPKGSTILL